MQWLSVRFLTVFLGLMVCLFGAFADIGDPYQILGISRHSTLQDIRRAYKQLAKEWHPDKSDHPTAESRFVEIKQSYELLVDPERRKSYDLHGITNEDNSLYKQRHDYSQYARYSNDPFEDLFGAHGNRFNFNDQDISLFHKMSVTTRHFENNLTPKSARTPHLILFYSDWCFGCMHSAPVWRRMMDALEPLGVVFHTVHAGHEAALARKVGVHSLPCIILLIDEKSYVYKDSVFSVQNLVDFIRAKMPYKLIGTVKDDSIDNFLTGWSDNKVRALVMEPRPYPRLRYVLMAFYYRHRVMFGFVQLGTKTSSKTQQRFKAHPSLDTVLIFNEDTNHPVASVSMADIPTSTLKNVISSNQYLALPRLSNQDMLDALCPPEWNRPRKKLCVILITENTDVHNKARESLRKLALEYRNKERVKFAYIYQEKQQEFVNSLIENGTLNDILLKVVIIWRRDTSHIKYEWFSDLWDGDSLSVNDNDSNLNDTRQKLEETIQKLLKASEALTYEAEIQDLLDEHAQSLIWRIITKLIITAELVMEHMGEEHILPALSVIATIVFILGVGYFMSYLVRIEEENIQKKRDTQENGSNNNNGSPRNSNYTPELKLHEMRVEKYNGLVRLLKPGCRTIVLLVDMQSRLKLLPVFHKVVWPYRKNKTLMFAHMSLERCLSWYCELLELALPEPRSLQINPRNCIGTVLALNGHRKYFCMYHAKHPESTGGAKRLAKMTRHMSSTSRDLEAGGPGAFIGMDTDSSDGEAPDILLEDGLLDGLGNWLDRLFEGTTHRYYINYWPELTK